MSRYADTQLLLARPNTVDKLCYPLNTEGEVSCCMGSKVVINFALEGRGPALAGEFRQDLPPDADQPRVRPSDRQRPRTCPDEGNLAPVMQQQTYGLQGCGESWPLASEL